MKSIESLADFTEEQLIAELDRRARIKKAAETKPTLLENPDFGSLKKYAENWMGLLTDASFEHTEELPDGFDDDGKVFLRVAINALYGPDVFLWIDARFPGRRVL